MSARLSNRRIRLLVAVFGLLFAATLARAAWLQAVRAPGLDRIAASQQRETVTVPARRGTIYDRQGVELAVGEDATTVYANPRQVRDPRGVSAVVARDLGLDPDVVYGALSDRSRGFVYVARKVDPKAAKRLAARGIGGLGFLPEERRVYPQGRIAAAVLGYVGTDNEGLAGIELEYEEQLAGRPGEETVVRDPFGRLLDVAAASPARQGRDLTLTIDHRLQAHVEDVLRRTRAAWSAKAATAIVLDIRTGAVLAMAVAPGFNANRFPDLPSGRVRNRAITDVFEPGSTFKVVTVAAVLDDRIVQPGSSFSLAPEIQVADRVIHELEDRETERLTVSEILVRSSNIGAITLALALGEDRLAWWIERFGLGQPTGIDFPGEASGIVLPRERWTGATIGNVPLGQGIAVTPIQLASIYAAIANGGTWVEPHLVERVEGGTRFEPEKRQLVVRRTARQLARMMAGVVSEGTGTQAQVPGYTVAGKTGTAAKPDASGGYSDSRYVASFVGFAPASAPRIAILVLVDEPKSGILGGTVAAPAFAEIAGFALRYLDVPPDALLADDAAGG